MLKFKRHSIAGCLFVYQKPGDTVDSVIQDIKNISVYPDGDKIVVDMKLCRHDVGIQMVLLCLSRLQPDMKAKTRIVEATVNDSDTRRFRISEQIDAYALHETILKDKVLQTFGRM